MAQFVGSKFQLDQEYPVRLGQSFLDNDASVGYCTVRYAFKPTTVADCKPGCLLLEPNSKRATLQLPKRGEAQQPDLKFEGSYDEVRDESEYVLLFDGECWTLERVDSVIRGLRYVKDVGPEDNLVSYLPQDDDDDSDLSDNGRNDVEADVHEQKPATVGTAEAGEAPRPANSSSSSESSSSSSSDSEPEDTKKAKKRARTAPQAPFLDGVLEPMEKSFFAQPTYDSSSDEDLNRCSDDEDSAVVGKGAF